MNIHHVFPYDPRHLGVTTTEWWIGQQQRWPIASLCQTRDADRTTVHVIGEAIHGRYTSPLRLRVHSTLYDNSSWHAWGDDWSLSLGAKLRAAGPDDIVVVHMEAYAAARLALRAAHRARCVLVLHGRGIGARQDHAAVDRVVVLHDESLKELVQSGLGGDSLIKVIPSVDRALFRPADRTKGHPIVLGYVGRLEESKGAFDLAPPLRQLKDLPVRLECIGSAPSAMERRRAASAFSGLPATLLGEKPPREVAARMRAWDALLLPSYTEGFSLVALEALSSGTPVVAVEGVLPLTVAAKPGVVTVPRNDFAGGIRTALNVTIPERGSDWIPDHADAARVWDQLYELLPEWRPRLMPSARPLLGRVRRVKWKTGVAHLPRRGAMGSHPGRTPRAQD